MRFAEVDDADAIARIQVTAWRVAYADILAAEFLAEVDEHDRAERWRTRVGPAMKAHSPTFVALDQAEAVRGFVHTGPARDDDLALKRCAEIYTLYVDPAAWGRGVGTALVASVDDFWGPTDVNELTLWVFEENAQGRAFYEQLGWRADGARQVDAFGGEHPVEIRYRRGVPKA